MNDFPNTKNTDEITTLTDPLTFDVITELSKFIFLRTEIRMKEGGSRVKETWNSDKESTWNEIKNDEMARVYALLNSRFDCDDKEIFRKVYCK